MQLKLGDNLAEKKQEIEEQKILTEKCAEERRKKEEYFNEHFKLGSTTVIVHEGKVYFYGDTSHCEKENIFHNARAIKERLGNHKFGHMNYNDPPTFSNWDLTWERFNHERINIYKQELYVFDGDEIKEATLNEN